MGHGRNSSNPGDQRCAGGQAVAEQSMCPNCISNMAMAIAGIGMTWSSGLAALILRKNPPSVMEKFEENNLKEVIMASSTIDDQKVVSRAEWLAARKALLAKEKELTRSRDELSRQRRELPWVKVEKPYTFDGSKGKETLSDLFDGRSQLIVYHFMFGPGWSEGCVGCSFLCDHVDGALLHLLQHDVSFA